MEKISLIVDGLKQVNGLSNFNLLSEFDKVKILALEEERNICVIKAIKMPNTLLLTHDSNFREPTCPIFVNGIFPPVPFPELNAKSVVSSSPSKPVHDYLTKKFNLNLKNEEATL